MKTKILCLIAGIGMLSMTGCAGNLALTDSKTDMVAEYAAGLVLKYDRYYKEEYIEPTVVVEEESAVTPTPILNSDVNKQNSSGGTSGSSGISEVANNSSSDSASSSKSSEQDGNLQANADFTEVIGIKGLTVEYSKYETKDNYSDPYFTIESGTGKKLLIITFNVKNTTKKDLKMNLEKSDIEYQIDLDNGKFEKPLLTFLDNDLRLIDTVVKAKSTIKTVLVFNVSEDIDANNVNIIISEKDKTAIVKLK